MTVYTQHFSDPEYRFLINRAVYYPQPLVDGAFVDFKLKRPNERRSDDMESKFLAFVDTVSLIFLSPLFFRCGNRFRPKGKNYRTV